MALKIIKLSNFFPIDTRKIDLFENTSILQQAIAAATGVGGTATSISPGSAGTGPTGPVNFKNLKLSQLFYATDIGSRIVKKLSGDRNKELLKELKDKGYFPSDLLEDPDKIEPNNSEVSANIAALQSAGFSVPNTADIKPLLRELPSSEDYKYEDADKITWDGMVKILKTKLKDSQIESLTDKYCLVGLRNLIQVKRKYPNRFTDILVLMTPRSKSDKKVWVYPATTVPGPFFMIDKFRNWWLAKTGRNVLNPKGLAVMQPGIYDYKIGNHNGYEALIQAGKVEVNRYKIVDAPNKVEFTTYSPGQKERGDLGINIHRAQKNAVAENIDNYSAGCVVFKKSSDLEDVLRIMKNNKQNEIKFVLLQLDDVPEATLAQISSGPPTTQIPNSGDRQPADDPGRSTTDGGRARQTFRKTNYF